MDNALKEQIISIINDTKDMTIATIREDGFPQATTVTYVNDGVDIYFITTADTQKAQNIAQNNKVSLTINRDYQTWNDIEGLSIGALATLIDDAEQQEQIWSLYMEKFPQMAELESMEDVEPVFFHVEPKVISLLDYRKGFGHTQLINL